MNNTPKFDVTKFSGQLDAEFGRVMQSNVSKTCWFIYKSANDWIEEAKNRPMPKMLFGNLWYEGELCLLFADTNVGKSILAVQIADAISRGISTLRIDCNVERQTVLYYDFELNDKQFETRYSDNFKDHYLFDDNLIRIEFNPDVELDGDGYETQVIDRMAQMVEQTNAKVLVIDNITYLRAATEQAKDAVPLMKDLKQLKSKYGLSILALAHTPKRDTTKALSSNDIQGSSMLANFCDSAFAIGMSHKENGMRYIKQIKQRNCEQVYGSDNVILCRIYKPHNFLKFEFVDYGCEWEHLKVQSQSDKEKLYQEVELLYKEGVSIRDMATKLGVSKSKVETALKNIKQSGELSELSDLSGSRTIGHLNN